MRYVLDASVAFKWPLLEIDSDKAELLRDDYRNHLHELIAPDIFPIEMGHALTRAERQGRIPAGDAIALWSDVMTTAPQLYPHSSLIARAIAISSNVRTGVYDSLYLALAEREQCELVTADAKLVKNLQARFPFLVLLASLP